ncbi:T9SS type A sorting domain-containing protein [Riemerella anatipestifer]|nr:T9SS type A sorting domain-containing protein [Riemerella anatipestifer]MDR7796280.1 T9SS type A sorting domain-containing protein [Riemerella anatipestifer]
MHYKNYFLVAGLCVAMLFKAQQTQPELYDPYTPEYFSVGKNDPAWLQLIVDNPSGVNFFEMEKKFGEWLDSDPDARRKTPEKKPAVNFYRRWQKAYRPFVNGNGEIVLPKKEDYLAKLDRQNQRSNQTMVKHQRGGLTTLGTNSTPANTNKWRNIGPYSTDYNSQHEGYKPSYDSHANVFRIDVSKTNPNILYSGAETGAVFKTTDKGKNWTACASDYNFGANITAIRIDPKDPNTVWVGSTLGLFVSDDGGNSFRRINNITTTVNSIRVSDDRKTVTVTTGESHKLGGGNKSDNRKDGFYRSTDSGKTFNRIISGIFYDHELKPNNSNVVYLYGRKQGEWYSKLYISNNGGGSFDNGREVLSGARIGRLAVSDAPNGENYIYALVTVQKKGYHYGEPHILQSTNGGQSWTDKTKITNNISEYQNTFCPTIDAPNGGQGYYDMMIGVSGTNPEHVIFGLCSAYCSLNGGEGGYKDTAIGGYCNFKMHADMQDIAIVGDEVWIANDGGIKYSPNFFKKDENGNMTTENRVKGIYASDYYGFGQGWNEDVMVGGRWHNGDAVMMENYGEGNAVYVGGVEQATGYVMVSNPKKVYFSDAGMFTMPNNIDGKLNADYFAFDRKKPYEALRANGFLGTDPRYAQRILYHAAEGHWGTPLRQIWETLDEGTNYSLLYNPSDNISNIEFARSNPNVIYACGQYDIYKSINNGQSWTSFKMPQFNGFFPTIAVDPKNENKIWVVQGYTNGGVAYSEDSGQTWVKPLENDADMKNIAFRWIVLAGDEHNGVYLGSDEGSAVYYKDDTMDKWINYSNGLPPAARLTRLIPFFKEGKLRAATSQGIWEIPLYRQKFTPVAQPMATNISQARLNDANMTVEFESYSIVNQDKVEWEWSFKPEPHYVSNKKVRNPKVIFKYNGKYDVTLKVTTPEGSHSRTIENMIIVDNGVLGTNETQASTNKVAVYPTSLNSGETLHIKRGLSQEQGKFRIYSADGALIKTVEIEANSGAEITVPTHGLQKGVYLFQYSTYNHIHRGKFIIK